MAKLDKKKKIAGIAGLAVLFIAIVAWLFVSGRVVVVWNNSGDRIEIAPRICSSDLISTYNGAFSAETEEEYKAKIDEAVQEVDQLSDTEQDPNCVYIRYTQHIEDRDTTGAREQLDILRSLADKGYYATNEIENVQGLDLMTQTIDSIDAVNSEESDVNQEGASGGAG